MRIETFSFEGRVPKEFRDFALAHRLWEETYLGSGFRALWEGRAGGLGLWYAHEGFLGSLAMEGGEPVGLGMLERRTQALDAETGVRKRAHGGPRPGPRPGLRPWRIRVVGFVGLYVRPDCRRRGIAAALLHRLEEARRAELDPVADSWSPEDVPAVIATGRAFPLAERAARLFRALPTEMESANRRSIVARLSREVARDREGDPRCTLRPLPDWTEWPGEGRFRALPAEVPAAAPAPGF